jgi:hypothetical protein
VRGVGNVGHGLTGEGVREYGCGCIRESAKDSKKN